MLFYRARDAQKKQVSSSGDEIYVNWVLPKGAN